MLSTECEVDGVRYVSAEPGPLNCCDGCAGDVEGTLCLDLGTCLPLEEESSVGIIWVKAV